MPEAISLTKTLGYAAHGSTMPLGAFDFERRAVGARDVLIEILYCGGCHSDLHMARNEWVGFPTVYPVVPGHEIVGRVTEVGDGVTRFKIGGLAAVGCMVDSCRSCPSCKEGLDQYCDGELTLTYDSPDKHTGRMTYGGYSDQIVVDEDFVLRISEKLDLAAAAPLLCAGITTYSPQVMGLIFKRRRLAGSAIGGIRETQEMLDCCAQQGIACDIELIPMQKINKAYERMLKSDVKYRFVISMSSLRASTN
jgi:uncharacterized zinc-type alcohol dehydrogenase-like protein